MALHLGKSYNDFNLTITPIVHDAGLKKPETNDVPNYYKQPDLTFHCMCCEAFFENPFQLFQHMNVAHPVLEAEQQECFVDQNDCENDDEFDYSYALEPVCEIVALAEKKTTVVTTNETLKMEKVEGRSESEDSETDDDDESTSSSSSTNSSSSTETTNSNSQSLDTTNLHGYNGDYGITDGTMEGSAVLNSGHELTAFSHHQSSIIMLGGNGGTVGGTTITPIMIPPKKRGRGRRSTAQLVPTLSQHDKCFQCVHCEASFQNAGDLSKHVRSHITNKPFQCSICEKTFTHIGSLNTHLRIHSGDKPYKCELCPKAFTQSSSLMVHIRSHSIRKPHQCHLCDKGFVNSSSLVLHLKTHNDMESFVCPECDKEFKQEDQLDEHMRMHVDELVYQCSICRNTFRTSSELVQHMKTHMGAKPFSCSICDARFTQSGSLNIHMRIHTGEKPFHCKICNKSFTQASSLSVHLKIHNSGEKPYPCHICGKAYSQQAYLNKHIQSHTQSQIKPSEKLMCIVCTSLHPDADSLARHVTQAHAALLTDMKDAQKQAAPLADFNEAAYIEHLQLLMRKQQQQEVEEEEEAMSKSAVDEAENMEPDSVMQDVEHDYCVAMEVRDNAFVVKEESADGEEEMEYDFDYGAEEEVETAE